MYKQANLPYAVLLHCSDETIQYFVLIEQKVLCQVPSFQHALFITFSCFYIFHLEYPKQIKNVLFFFQGYIVAYLDSLKRPGTYLAVDCCI